MATEPDKAPQPENVTKKHEFVIFVDAKRYVVDKSSMTGAEIKALAHIDAQYQLFLEEQGDRPDKAISDTEAVSIREDMHFYAIPAVTMGRISSKA
jgi:hypothetical protein